MSSGPARSRLLSIAWFLTLSANIAVPLIVSLHGRDAFRTPKLAILQGAGILVAGILALGVVVGWIGRADWRRHRHALALTAAVLVWTAITAGFSAASRVSWESTITVVSAASFFLAALLSAPSRPLREVALLTVGGLVNSALLILQAADVWTAVQTEEMGRMTRVGLLGNPNDVAMYLIAPAVTAAGLAIAAKGLLRWYGGLAAAVIAAGLLLTQSATAIVAAAAAGLAMAVMSYRAFASRRIILAIGLGSVVLAAGFAASRRVVGMFEQFGEGGLDSLMTGRMLAFTSAIEMIRDHPLVGVGPGMFSWHYFTYAPLAEAKYGPFSFASTLPVVFSEAHNDHLQIAAEAGLPGLLLFWAALTLVFIQSRRGIRGDRRSDFARVSGPSVSIGLAVLALAQFPLQLPASLLALVVTFGLCLGWSSQG